MKDAAQAESHRHALRLAAGKLGGHTQLRAYLGVPNGQLLRWMAGFEALPRDVFLRLVSLVLEKDGPPAADADCAPESRSPRI